MKYTPTPAAKQIGNTASNKEWVDHTRREIKGPIGWRAEPQHALDLEIFDQLSPGYSQDDEQQVLQHELGPADPIERQNTNLISNNPRRFKNNTDRFVDYATTNMKYDPTIEQSVLRDGYKLNPVEPSAENYTGEHSTGFYTELERKDKETGKTVKGFLYRNNYLSRI